MFLLDILKRNLLGSVQVSCANDTENQPSTSQDPPSETKKCRPRKPTVVAESDICQGVKGKQGKTGAGVTGAGGGVAGGGTGDYGTGGGDDRGGGIGRSEKRGKCAKSPAPTEGVGDSKSRSRSTGICEAKSIETEKAGSDTGNACSKKNRIDDETTRSELGKGNADDSRSCLAVDGLPKGAKHPGLLRHLHNGARNRFPSCFEGAFVCVKQSPLQNWIFGHTISFSSVCPGGYKLLSSYVDKDSPGQLPYFVMDAAPGGQASCEARVPITSGTKATVFAQIANAELYSFETIIDTCFNSFTASLIAVNREFIALHYLQAVTNELCLGAEVSIRGQGSESSSLSAAARYMNEHNFLSATFGSRGLDMCYARAINPILTVAAMLEIGFAIRNAVATLGYEWRASDWTVRASMDSDGLVGCTLHRTFPGTYANFGCAFSGLLNHPNDKFRMGFGINATLI